MTLLYKLTAADGTTHGNTKWGPGVTHSGTGEGELCGPGWIHAYTHPLLAALFNPLHAGFANPLLWEAEGEVGRTDCGLKVGCKTLTTIRRIKLPRITREQRIRFTILCVKQVYKDTDWNAWADKWLSGEDRSMASAYAAAAYNDAYSAACAANVTATAVAANAAHAKPINLIAIAEEARK